MRTKFKTSIKLSRGDSTPASRQKLKFHSKKQIFVAIYVERDSSSNVINQIRSWIPDFQASRNSGGLQFVSDIPLSTDPYKSQIVRTSNIMEEDKKTFCLMKSLDYFKNTSRAFWYLSIPVNAYVNVAAIKSFTETLGSYDPMKNETIYQNCANDDCAMLLSRAAVNTLTLINTDLPEIRKIISDKSQPFPNSFFVDELSDETASLIESGSLDNVQKCKGNEENRMKLKKSFVFFVSPVKMGKMKIIKDAKDNIMAGSYDNRTVFCSL
jgi:hypothetical protein